MMLLLDGLRCVRVLLLLHTVRRIGRVLIDAMRRVAWRLLYGNAVLRRVRMLLPHAVRHVGRLMVDAVRRVAIMLLHAVQGVRGLLLHAVRRVYGLPLHAVGCI